MRTFGRQALLAAGVCFAVFVANTIYGKISVLRGATEVPGLGDVGEFLVLFVAVLFFIVACLEREKAQDRQADNDDGGASPD